MSEPHQGNFVEKKIILKSNRVFFLKFVEFNNGCFVSFSEDLCKIGGIHVSVASNNRTQSARVIPNIKGSHLHEDSFGKTFINDEWDHDNKLEY